MEKRIPKLVVAGGVSKSQAGVRTGDPAVQSPLESHVNMMKKREMKYQRLCKSVWPLFPCKPRVIPMRRHQVVAAKARLSLRSR